MKYAVLVLALAGLTFGCGRANDEEYTDAPAPDAEWDAIAADVSANCGKCHNGVKHPFNINSAAAFKSPKVKTRIANGTMPPPPAQLPADVKARFLAYLD